MKTMRLLDCPRLDRAAGRRIKHDQPEQRDPGDRKIKRHGSRASGWGMIAEVIMRWRARRT